MLIDSHCHLSIFARRGDLDEILNEASLAGVNRMITIGTSVDDWELYHDLAQQYPGKIYHSIGLHPCDVKEDWESQIEQLSKRLNLGGDAVYPVALGEIGLDYFHLPKDPETRMKMIERQKQAFEAQLAIATALRLPVIVHSRNAFDDCVKMIDSNGAFWDHVVFHCFNGGKDEIDRINLRGGRGSFTGIITYDDPSIKEVRASLIEQGAERLMIETDCPYLTPIPHRGKENRPAYLRHTFQRTASLLQIPVVELEEIIARNTFKFFGINS
jgi:TatD DNase family protein